MGRESKGWEAGGCDIIGTMRIKEGASPEERLAEAERRIEEARRTGAESLELADLALHQLPPSIGSLPHLKSLSLGIYELPNDGIPNPHSRSPKFTDLSPLAKLKNLQTLHLGGCEDVADLGPLAELKGLHILYLGKTGVRDLSPLAKLQRLQRLHAWHTGVSDLRPLAELKELQALFLRGTGVMDLALLTNLQRLKDLDLSETDVTDFRPLAEIQGLQHLQLDSTNVKDLEPLARLQSLQSLDLSWSTGVTDLSPLAKLQGLRLLFLHGCRPDPATFRLLANHPSLTKLCADEVAGIPRESLSHELHDNCLPRLRAYLSELKLGAEAENEVKVILLGNSHVGKTQLCRRFRDEPFDESILSTHGVQIWRRELRVQTGGQEQVFQINWWDFGGQDIYHGTHALFLRSRAVFLILWTPSLENRNEYHENGLTLRNQPLAYWLDYVRSLAGEGSPVIVVQSQCERLADERPGARRPEGLGFF